MTARPTICLNMIVKNEAHIVAEVLDSVAPYISSWVIVDTGSDDGTQDLIRNHMARLGIPGELHERPWRNFGHNRTEALTLAQGHGDYIWVMDADDTIVGTPDFTRLSADIYLHALLGDNDVFWRAQLFRDGVRVRWEGVIHEYAMWDDSCVVVRLEGDYHIEDRHLGARNQDPRRSMRATAICCWPRSNATPRMRGRCSTWPRATSVWAISSTRASGMRGGSRWAAGTRRSTTRCTGSRSRWRNSVSRGRMFRTPTCGPGSFDRPAPSRCMPSPAGIAPISATGSVTCSPSAPPKSRSPNRRPVCPPQTSMPGE